jgi:hypothetical protein
MCVPVNVCLRRVVVLWAAAVALLLPAHASGQAVVDAGRLEFTPSADHNATSDGVSVVTSYELQVFVVGTSVATRSVNLGKPGPEADGFIRLDFLALLSSPLAPAVQYQARVAAIGPGGTTPSALSNIFSYTPTCEPTLSSTGASLPAGASTGSVTVNAASGCTWSATSPVNWISITSGDSGSGTRDVTFSATANQGSSTRSATLTIATRSFVVSQAGVAGCSYSISPTSRSPGAGGETATVAVKTGSGCTWSATSHAGWLTVNQGTNRTGSGNVSIVVAANDSTARTGTVTVAGRTFTVNQAAGCSFTVTPTTISSNAAGKSGTIRVTTGSNCSWNARTVPTWMTMSTNTRTGSQTIPYTIATNTGRSSRRATLSVAGRDVDVSQSGTTGLAAPSGLRVIPR